LVSFGKPDPDPAGQNECGSMPIQIQIRSTGKNLEEFSQKEHPFLWFTGSIPVWRLTVGGGFAPAGFRSWGGLPPPYKRA
jgi:hypothetical protein